MKKLKILIFIAIILVTLCNAAFTAEISGVGYIEYSYNLQPDSGAQDFNAFDLSRFYIHITDKLQENIKFKGTLDLNRDSDGFFRIFVKYLMLTYEEFLPSLSLTAGLQDTPWIGFEEKIWEHRFVSKVFADLEGKETSADLGLSIKAKIPSNLGEVIVGIYNGEGYKKPEINKFKTARARITLFPDAFVEILKGIKISGFASYGIKEQDPLGNFNEYATYIGLISYQSDFLTLAAEYMGSAAQSSPTAPKRITTGLSGFTVIKIEKAGIFIRTEQIDTDKEDPTPGYTRLITGISYKIGDKVTVALDSQIKTYQVSNKPRDNIGYLHMEIKY